MSQEQAAANGNVGSFLSFYDAISSLLPASAASDPYRLSRESREKGARRILLTRTLAVVPALP